MRDDFPSSACRMEPQKQDSDLHLCSSNAHSSLAQRSEALGFENHIVSQAAQSVCRRDRSPDHSLLQLMQEDSIHDNGGDVRGGTFTLSFKGERDFLRCSKTLRDLMPAHYKCMNRRERRQRSTSPTLKTISTTDSTSEDDTVDASDKSADPPKVTYPLTRKMLNPRLAQQAQPQVWEKWLERFVGEVTSVPQGTKRKEKRKDQYGRRASK